MQIEESNSIQHQLISLSISLLFFKLEKGFFSLLHSFSFIISPHNHFSSILSILSSIHPSIHSFNSLTNFIFSRFLSVPRPLSLSVNLLQCQLSSIQYILFFLWRISHYISTLSVYFSFLSFLSFLKKRGINGKMETNGSSLLSTLGGELMGRWRLNIYGGMGGWRPSG